jgi:regulator of replication initiation timing
VRSAAEQDKESLAERMNDALHGLCQPLTVLQCRLAMGKLVGDLDSMREAIADALAECTRVNLEVGLMREMLQHTLQMDRDEQERTGRIG